MTSTLPSPDAASRPEDQKLVPPDERFWRRYSPHGELPLSGASSLAVHLLLFGLLLLSAWLAFAVFRQAGRALPVDAVRLEPGGNPQGDGKAPGAGNGLIEQGKGEEEISDPITDGGEKRPPLKANADVGRPIQFDEKELRRGHPGDAMVFDRLREANQRIRGTEGQRRPGGGKDGEGDGPGVGKQGKGKLAEQRDRMLRWSLLFDTQNGRDYVAQLGGLGAILAVPVGKDEKKPDFKIIRDLSARPAKLLDEDIGKIQRIFWVDDKPQSVGDVMAVLGVKAKPSYFVAFMPEDLENKLLKLEKAYLEKHHKGRTEGDIDETRFRIKRIDRRYEPEVISLRLK
jgi:hypothetical protein